MMIERIEIDPQIQGDPHVTAHFYVGGSTRISAALPRNIHGPDGREVALPAALYFGTAPAVAVYIEDEATMRRLRDTLDATLAAGQAS